MFLWLLNLCGTVFCTLSHYESIRYVFFLDFLVYSVLDKTDTSTSMRQFPDVFVYVYISLLRSPNHFVAKNLKSTTTTEQKVDWKSMTWLMPNVTRKLTLLLWHIYIFHHYNFRPFRYRILLSAFFLLTLSLPLFLSLFILLLPIFCLSISTKIGLSNRQCRYTQRVKIDSDFYLYKKIKTNTKDLLFCSFRHTSFICRHS